MESADTAESPFAKLRAAILVIVLAVVWFGALEYRELFDPDEGRYAEISLEMLSSGDWITPRLNGLKYFEKPAFQYWITAAAFAAFGVEEWTARLWPALSGLLTVGLVYLAGRHLGGPRAALIASVSLASSILFFAFSQILTLDMGVTFFLTLTMTGFLLSRCAHLAEPERRRWMLASWAAMGFAVLSKGLIGVVLPGMVLGAHVLIRRDFGLLRRVSFSTGAIVFAAITLPWFIAVQFRNPEFFEFFFVHEHFTRFSHPDHRRPGPWYYFALVLLAGGLPWTVAQLRALWSGWRLPTPRTGPFPTASLLVLWVVVIVVFFSLSSSKLPGYILPVFPALALLTGLSSATDDQGLRRDLALGLLVTCGLLAGAALALPRIPKIASDLQLIAAVTPWVIGTAIVFLALALLALSRRIATTTRVVASALGALLAFHLLVAGSQSVANRFSVDALIEEAQAEIGGFLPNAPFYSVNMYNTTLPLHLGRTVTLVGWQGELAMGISQEPDRFVATLEEFRARWQQADQAYAILLRGRYEQELARGLPMIVAADNGKVTIVARRRPGEPLPPVPHRF